MPSSPVDMKGFRAPEMLGPVLPQPLFQKEPFESPAQGPQVLAGARCMGSGDCPASSSQERLKTGLRDDTTEGRILNIYKQRSKNF